MPDREDLLREATALVERVELSIAGFEQPIVCGFRRDGSASFFFGPDPVFQFNTAFQLRRAFVGGKILKAEGGRLVALARVRASNEVSLVRHELTENEVQLLINDLRSNLQRLQAALEANSFTLNGQVPADAPMNARVLAWLKNAPKAIEIAAAPNVR
ncbi:MAG TPA: hypothetical protein VGI40_02735 [Pirellulaceae bacterium]|jgi:hypothetical protein